MAKKIARTATITARISPSLNKKLDGYARITGNTKSRAIERLLQEHIDYETWFIKEVRKGIASADSGELVSHESAVRRIHEHVARRKREKHRAA
jgi:predicted transcriptional regulator